MKLSIVFPAMIPGGLLAMAAVMIVGTSAPKGPDDPRAAMPELPKHVDHAKFFDVEDFVDVRDDLEQISHRVTEKCLDCHPDSASEVMATSHWNWKGDAVKVPGTDRVVQVGKSNLINDFCISVRSNWPRCTNCHVGYGWRDDTFDFTNPKNVDCLVCHEQTGGYAKEGGKAGYPLDADKPKEPDPNYQVEYMLGFARSVASSSRDNCGTCHFAGGGGDAVKHGDLNGFQYNPSAEIDVHMGGHGMRCIDCHRTEDHDIQGHSMGVSFEPSKMVKCTDCHAEEPHREDRLNAHTHTVACATCHIPTIAKGAATKMWWDWSKAGLPQEEAMKLYGLTNPHDYYPIKGLFRYEEDAEPEYRWYNGFAKRYITGDPIEDVDGVLSINQPLGDIQDPNARIYPFKVHRGMQPYDLNYKYLLIPKTYGDDGFWGMTRNQEHEIPERWHLSFLRGAEESGLPYSGSETGEYSYGWIQTEMYWPQAHMVADAEDALQCNDCHTEDGHTGRMDWEALGYGGDPAYVGGREQTSMVQEYEPWTREEYQP